MIMIFKKAALVVLLMEYVHVAHSYCTPTDKCWPNATSWNDLRKSLGGPLVALSKDNYNQCEQQGNDAYSISKTGNGMCMQYHDCSKEFCNGKSSVWNIPAYSVEVRTNDDIKKALKFANKYKISVTVKTSGHNFAGSSMGKDTLLIWMYNFKKYGNIKTSFKDTCATKTFSNVLHIGGGQTWKEAYAVVGDKFHVVGGGCLTVGASGGWLMGGGLSALTRNLGMGVDNVLQFNVILADGKEVIVDKCTNPDLFWALRGGGGGTFGIVTSVHYQLHPVSKIIFVYLAINDIAAPLYRTETVDSFIDFWVEKSPYLDKRWGGYWTLHSLILYFQGSRKDADTTFLDDLEKWKSSLKAETQKLLTYDVGTHKSYYDQRGRKKATTDKTGENIFNIADRLIPRDSVVNDPEKAKSTLKWMVRNGFFTINYLVGGVMMDKSATETAVHPATRKAIWQIETFSEKMIEKLRSEYTDTGVGLNHASKVEPDWENAFWGANLPRLKQLKKKYDPNNRFNCWHCVGYTGPTPACGFLCKPFVFVVLLCAVVHHWLT